MSGRSVLLQGTELSGYSQAHLDVVARELKDRPRRTLGGRSPPEAFAEVVGWLVEPAAHADRSPLYLTLHEAFGFLDVKFARELSRTPYSTRGGRARQRV